MRPELVSFRIDELLRQLEVEFAPLAREKGLELDFVPCSLAVRSDRRLLRRLLQNLVSNAIKYTPKGRVLVGCRRAARQAADRRLRHRPRHSRIARSSVIFREFHRLDEGAKVARGLGLGLSIVERIARVLDHKIELRSAPGRGSRFSVEVPLLERRAAVAVRRATPPRVDRGQLAGIAVLCIDNEPQILDGMETLLGGWGCRGAQGAGSRDRDRRDRARRRTPPNGLLVDYHLDQGNGIDAIAELRRRFGADLPAILITADRSPQVRDEARAQDVQVLNKPLKPAALRALMAQWRVQRVAAAE